MPSLIALGSEPACPAFIVLRFEPVSGSRLVLPWLSALVPTILLPGTAGGPPGEVGSEAWPHPANAPIATAITADVTEWRMPLRQKMPVHILPRSMPKGTG